MEGNTIVKTALAIVTNKKLLMVSSDANGTLYTLGGKVESGETDHECLAREVKEEIGCHVVDESLRFLAEFRGDAHGKNNTLLILRLYYGVIIGRPTPNSEIVSITYVDSSCDPSILTPVGLEVIQWLHRHQFIG